LIDLSNREYLINDDMNLYVYVSELLNDYESGYKHIFINYDEENYIVPVWVGKSDQINESEIIVNESQISFLVENKSIELLMLKNESKYLSIEFQNKGESTARNLGFYLIGNISDIADLEYNSLNMLISGEIAKQHIFINKDKGAFGLYNGYLIMEEIGDDGINRKIDSINLSFYFYEQKEQLPFSNSLDSNINMGNLDDYENEEQKKEFRVEYWIIAGFLFLLILIYLILRYVKYKKDSSFIFPPFHHLW
jgi:hypothetical protein